MGFTANDIALLIGAMAGRDELDDYSESKKEHDRCLPIFYSLEYFHKETKRFHRVCAITLRQLLGDHPRRTA